MKAAPFHYHRASSIADAVATLARSGGEAKVIAGGQSLVPLLAMRLAQPQVLVDIGAIPGLAGIEAIEPTARAGGRVLIGALTRHAELAAQAMHPLLAEAAAQIGHQAIRNRGTVGGSLAHADPNAELPTIALATDAVLSVEGPGGSRVIPVEAFFDGMLQTALADDELLTGVELAAPRRWGFAELARRHGDFAIVLTAVAELNDGWRVAVGGVGSTPIRSGRAERLLDDAAPVDGGGGAEPVSTEDDAASLADVVGAAAADEIEPYDDLHASARYRRVMAGELVRRAALAALARRPGPTPGGTR